MSRPAPSRRAFLTGLTSLTLTLAACGANSRGAASASGTPSAGGTLYVLSSDTDVNWDPARSQSLAVTSLGLVHRRLTTWELSPGGEPRVVPDLATDTGTVSADGLTWTYTLKEGLVLSDGTPITSAHVKHGLERSFAPALSGGLGYHKTLLAGTSGYTGPYEGAHLDSVATPDERTVVLTLARPYGDWPWIVSTPAFAPVPEGDDPATYTRNPLASGPYVVSEYKQGVSVTLSRNEHWSAATDTVRLGLPDTVVFSLGQDEDTVSQRLIADSGDDRNAFSAQLLTASKLAQVSADPSASARLATSDPGPLLYLAVNTERVTDPDVRRAIAYAVDKAAVQQALSEVGLTVRLDPQSSDAYSQRATQGDGSSYDLAVVSWNPDYPSANANIQPLYASSEIGGGGYNVSRYSDAEVDRLIAEATAEPDAVEAGRKWAALDRRIAQDVPAVPLVNRRNSFLRGSQVAGFFVNPFPAYPDYLVVGVGA